ncbi:LapA family protein [Paraglaciecola aquimarina]|uniref:LapA family protein n=1 Tax=Paraglaciecola algarum TaxID=3050085 RepID=A0ABS9D286_9ALTE|nr:LapA family protein [Paraglaciecola sp. G1-23]MCF2947030.1 LapA family protein [Paraglaciecola sp. G1-23]
MKLKGLLLLIFVLMVLVIAGFVGSQNSHLVSVNYLINDFTTQIKMSYILAVSFSLGFLVCFILILAYLLKLKWRISSLERKNKKLSQASHSQKTLSSASNPQKTLTK